MARLTRSVGVVAALLALLVAGVVTGVAAVKGRDATAISAEAAQAPIDGYPQRIPFDRPSPKLPDRPGPLAATMDDNDFGSGRELGVTSRGRLWELPVGVNVLSPDGSVLFSGESNGFSSPLSVHDLSTGERHVFDDIGETYDARERRRFRYLIDQQAAIYWAQDGSALLARLGEAPRPSHSTPKVLDVTSGILNDLAGAEPAGFRSPSEPVTVTKVGGKDASGGIVATTTNLETGETQDLALRLDGPWLGDPDSNLSASVSPDGSTLLLIETSDFPKATLRLFALTDGSEFAPRQIDNWDGCSPDWLDDDPVVPTKSQAAGSALVTSHGSRPLVAVHYRLQSSCLQLAAAALDAGPHPALFGTWTYHWTWYWQPLLAMSLAMLGLAWMGWRRRARHAWARRRRCRGSARQTPLRLLRSPGSAARR